MKKFSPIIILVFASLCARAQFSAEFRMALVKDNRYNTFTQPIILPPFVDNLGSFLTEIKGDYRFRDDISAFVSARLVTRKFAFRYSPAFYAREFYYNVMEIPFGLQYSKTINASLKLYISAGGGLNFATTDTKHATGFSTEGDIFQIVKEERPGWFIQTGIALENKLNDNSSIVFFLNGQLQVSQVFHYYSYTTFLSSGTYDRGRKGHYLSLGAGYKFSSHKKAKE